MKLLALILSTLGLFGQSVTAVSTAPQSFSDGSSYTCPLLGQAATAYNAAYAESLDPAHATLTSNYSTLILSSATQAQAQNELQAAIATGPVDYEIQALGWGAAQVMSQRNRYGYAWAPSYGQSIPSPLSNLTVLADAPPGAIIVSCVPPAPYVPPAPPAPAPALFNVGWYVGGSAPGTIGAQYAALAGPTPSPVTISGPGTLPIGTQVKYVGGNFTMFGQIFVYQITGLALN